MAAHVQDAVLHDCIPEEPPRCSSVAPSLTFSDITNDDAEDLNKSDTESDPAITLSATTPIHGPRRRRASTRLIAQTPADVRRITGESTTELINRCCGGGCCRLAGPANAASGPQEDAAKFETVILPDNDAFRSLKLNIDEIKFPTTLTNVTELPYQTVHIEPLRRPSNPPSPTENAAPVNGTNATSTNTNTSTLEKSMQYMSLEGEMETKTPLDTTIQPPNFVQPHPPYNVYPARIHNARSLTRPGAEKRTYHFDIDVTTYPGESGVDFKVGGAIGVAAPNEPALVDEIFDLLLVPRFIRNKPALLRTTNGRWPTVWGEDQARELVTNRRDLLTWCSDIQSYPPNKALLRVMAEHATDEDERKLLMFLCSGEGQGVFCDFRTGPHISLVQLLHAFPSSKPPLDLLLTVLQPLMPRFYSLSNDPHESYSVCDGMQHRLVEIAVTVHDSCDWRNGTRTGTGSGFFERQAKAFIAARERGDTHTDFYVPMFKGLMANPLAKQFQSDGPMLLIGAGVGIAPFRGFVQRRLKTANCANKVWVLQGVRDSLVDELYSGEWGINEEELKRVVESRSGEGRYVQEEVLHQAELVWYIVNAVDGRVFVCGSTKGMGEGVEGALVEVAMEKGNLEREEAKRFWELKKEVGQYIAETW